MAGDSDSLRAQLTIGKVSAAEEYAGRAPLSPVTNKASHAVSVGKRSTRSSHSTRSSFRDAIENEGALQDVGSISTSLQLPKQAEGATSSRFCMSPFAGSAETSSNSRHRRHARNAPSTLGSEAIDVAPGTSRRLASMASLESEVSFSQIAEEAQNLAHDLHVPVRPLLRCIKDIFCL